jgi:hypothetical protein
MYKEIETIIELVKQESRLSDQIRLARDSNPDRIIGLEHAKHLLQERMIDQCRFIYGIDWRSKEYGH